MNKNRLPKGLWLVALLQIIPPLVLPPQMLRGVGLYMWIAAIALFALLGVSLLRRRSWSRVATIFVQGLNIIVRVLALLPNATQGGQPGAPVDVWLVGTTALSIMLSAAILYYVDLPDIQVAMTQPA